MVPEAAFSLKGKWKLIGKNGKYLFPIHKVSSLYKTKFMDKFKRMLNKNDLLINNQDTINIAYNKKWVVYAEPSLAKSDHVIKYLGAYTHRVAISNNRIIKIENQRVFFRAKDYRKNGKQSVCNLSGVEFLRNFCLHILPKRFVKIRRFGIYNHTTKASLDLEFTSNEKSTLKFNKALKAKETTVEKIIRLTGFDITQCPFCKKGKMHKIKTIPRIRSPGFSF